MEKDSMDLLINYYKFIQKCRKFSFQQKKTFNQKFISFSLYLNSLDDKYED